MLDIYNQNNPAEWWWNTQVAWFNTWGVFVYINEDWYA